jgi:hypothetical protein
MCGEGTVLDIQEKKKITQNFSFPNAHVFSPLSTQLKKSSIIFSPPKRVQSRCIEKRTGQIFYFKKGQGASALKKGRQGAAPFKKRKT